MTKTIAKAFGKDSNRCKATHRLGSISSAGEANTWRTFSRTYINADGSGRFQLKRDGEIIYTYEWGPENGA